MKKGQNPDNMKMLAAVARKESLFSWIWLTSLALVFLAGHAEGLLPLFFGKITIADAASDIIGTVLMLGVLVIGFAGYRVRNETINLLLESED